MAAVSEASVHGLAEVCAAALQVVPQLEQPLILTLLTLTLALALALTLTLTRALTLGLPLTL